jgi:hypothetical protein
MALDFYAGPLTRYYAGTWETPGARFARERGSIYRTIRPSSATAEDAITDPVRIEAGVRKWRTDLRAALAHHVAGEFSWDEGRDVPYLSERPTWEGYAGVLLCAAHAECPDIPEPEAELRDWTKDDAYKRVSDPGFCSRFPGLYDVEIWLPYDFTITFRAEDLPGTKRWFGSSVQLLDSLVRLNRERFDVDFSKGWTLDGRTSFESSALFGIELFTKVAQYSVSQKVPLVLDF